MIGREHHEKKGVHLLKEPFVEPEWVDYSTAERFSSLSHTTLWRYVGNRELKAARVGRNVRIHLPKPQSVHGGTLRR
jgi:hypothetical protein